MLRFKICKKRQSIYKSILDLQKDLAKQAEEAPRFSADMGDRAFTGTNSYFLLLFFRKFFNLLAPLMLNPQTQGGEWGKIQLQRFSEAMQLLFYQEMLQKAKEDRMCGQKDLEKEKERCITRQRRLEEISKGYNLETKALRACFKKQSLENYFNCILTVTPEEGGRSLCYKATAGLQKELALLLQKEENKEMLKQQCQCRSMYLFGLTSEPGFQDEKLKWMWRNDTESLYQIMLESMATDSKPSKFISSKELPALLHQCKIRGFGKEDTPPFFALLK